ncbi:MAG: PspC domain-containing protein [Rikenellaceae bacterium]
MENTNKLRRSRTNRVMAGICAGIATYLGLSATKIRWAFVLLAIFGGLSIWIYIGMWIIIPEEPRINNYFKKH